jgi:hypothetical protein
MLPKVRDKWVYVCLVIALLPVAPVQSAEPSAEAIAYFEKEVRPLLIEHCQKCHGEKKQESSLRVDSRAALLQGGDSGPSIVPNKPKEGTFLAAIRHVGDLHMPPAGKLPDRTIAVLEKWVADGAAWPEEKGTATARTAGISEADRRHWAFQPVQMPAVPTVKDTAWARSDLDRFILAKLESKGLKPVGMADKRTLIRRVTFDLTGLPPTPEEIANYLKDNSADSFNKVVERLLASKPYGERWGRHWLDVARYADTAGDGSDYPVREAYKYRDWVIDAFNRDMPYDQFLRQQIAGDILAKKAPVDQYASKVTATGFLAVGKRYGYNPGPDYQHLDFADVIESVGRSLMGLSLGCARCHDHKYEPISAADYYAMYGILQSTQWAFPGGEEQKRPTQFPPLVPPEEAARLDRIKATELTRLADQLVKLNEARAQLEGKFWAGGIDLALEGQPLDKPPGGVWLSSGPNRVLASAQSPFEHVHPAGNRGVRLGSATSGDGVRYVFQKALKATPGKQMHFSIDFRPVAETTTLGSHRFYLGRGVIASQALECSLTKTEFAIRHGSQWEVVRKLVPGEWYTLRLTIDPEKKTYSGIVGKPGDLTSFEGKQLAGGWDGVLDTFICDGNGHSISKSAEHDLDNIGLQETPFGMPGTKVAPPAPPPADLKARLAKLDVEIKAVGDARAVLETKEAYPVAYGVSEGTPGNAKIQKRGEPDKLGAEVPRRFLEILGSEPIANKSGSGRLDLAEWVTRPSNPLTARVFVNRIWGWHFGRGLVPTPSDFGTRGEAPTHPELLDWLASYFVKSGWSVKAMHRLIVHSRVYQMASADDSANMKSDPENHYLWRHSRRALDAESIRDAMLAVSGKLDRAVPGQHPFPPVNTWGFTIHAPFHAVYDSDHRSVYLMLQRNRRHPFLALFDAADPNISTAERLPTITPTQSLYLMNSPFVHEQANLLGKRLLAQPGNDSARIRYAFELANGRSPTDQQVEVSLAFVKAYAQKLTERKAKDPIPSAWNALGRVLLTDNAFLYVD